MIKHLLLSLILTLSYSQEPDRGFQRQNDIYGEWNTMAESIMTENPLLERLLFLYKDQPPRHFRSTERIKLLEKVVVQNEIQLAAAKKLLELEKK